MRGDVASERDCAGHRALCDVGAPLPVRQIDGGGQRVRGFARVGQTSVAVEVTSVVRASDSSFQVRWIERSYARGSLAATERWTAILSIVIQPPRTEERLRRNPLGIYINGLSWSKELGS